MNRKREKSCTNSSLRLRRYGTGRRQPQVVREDASTSRSRTISTKCSRSPRPVESQQTASSRTTWTGSRVCSPMAPRRTQGPAKVWIHMRRHDLLGQHGTHRNVDSCSTPWHQRQARFHGWHLQSQQRDTSCMETSRLQLDV